MDRDLVIHPRQHLKFWTAIPNNNCVVNIVSTFYKKGLTCTTSHPFGGT